MGEDQIALQGLNVGSLNLDRRELAKSRIDALDGLVAAGNFGDAPCRGRDSWMKGRIEPGGASLPVHCFQNRNWHGAGMKRDGHDYAFKTS